jgi:parvulin-like peptidyl-prolyl isomerase
MCPAGIPYVRRASTTPGWAIGAWNAASDSSNQIKQSVSGIEHTAPKSPVSLAEIARATSAQRARSPKASWVFTNDNLPTSGGISIVGQRSPSADKSASTDDGNPADPSGEKSETHWRERFSQVRTKLRQHQEAVEIMQRELGELNVQYYPNPQEALAQSITRSDINSKVAAIEVKKREIAALQQQLSDMEDELRKSGGDPGWARE